MKIDLCQRIVLEKSALKKLVFSAKNIARFTWRKFESKLNTSRATLRNTYTKENRTISYLLFQELCNLAKIPPSERDSLIQGVRNKGWQYKYMGTLGGLKNRGKNGEGRLKYKITRPEKSTKLAEFAGILYGDGYLSSKIYTIQVSLNLNADSNYSMYVTSLIKELFSINMKIYDLPIHGLRIVRINSKELYNFLMSQQFMNEDGKKRVPDWVLRNEEYLKAFVRGLVDTDGSMYFSSRWCILNFKSIDKEIRHLFKGFLNNYGIPTIESGLGINATSLWKIKKYLSLVGTSNLKNVIKLLEYTENRRTILTKDLEKNIKDYKNIPLPYFYKGLWSNLV